MTVETHRLRMDTRGNTDIVDLTPAVREALEHGSIRDGVVTVFCVGSTGGSVLRCCRR